MHIGFVSPVNIQIFHEYLDLKVEDPKGYKGATAPSLLIVELLKNGHYISIFTICPELELGDSTILEGNNLIIYVGSTRKRVKSRVTDLYYFERSYLKKMIQKENPDVLHSHWQYEYSWAALDSGIKTLVTCRDSPLHVLRYQPSLFRFIRLIIALYIINRAKCLSATSSYLAKNIRYLTISKNVLIIPNFEPDWLFSLYKSKADHYNSQHKIVMINNGFTRLKNVGVGIKAFQIYRENNSGVTLHLYGSGFSNKGEAHEWANKNNLLTNVYFHGIKDFNLLMQDMVQYHLLIHTSFEETFGNIMSEAMSLGIPVIGGQKSGAIPWVVGKNYYGGILTDIKSPNKIAEAIDVILKDESTYLTYSLNARDEAVSRFTSKIIVPEYEKVYQNLIS